MSVCIFDPMLRPVLIVCDMNEADKTMRKYWFVAVMLLALCWGAEAERDRVPSRSSVERERDHLFSEIKTLRENTLRRIKEASPALADRLVYEMFYVVEGRAYDLWYPATSIEHFIYGDRKVSEKAHRLDQLRKPYEALGLTYDCASSQASPHQVRVYVSGPSTSPSIPISLKN